MRALTVGAVLLMAAVASAEEPSPASVAMWRADEVIMLPEFQTSYLRRGNDNTAHAQGGGFVGGLTVAKSVADRTLIGVHVMYAFMTNPRVYGAASADGDLGMVGVGPVLMGVFLDDSTYFSMAALLTSSWGGFTGVPASSSGTVGLGFKATAGHLWRLGLGALGLGVCGSAFASENWPELMMAGLGAGVCATY